MGVKEILSGQESPAHAAARDELPELRQMLFKCATALQQAGNEETLQEEFDKLLWVCHLQAAKAICNERGLTQTASKLAVALLKWVRDIPADKAFYESCIAAKE